MAERFIDVTPEVEEMIDEVRAQWFPQYGAAMIKPMFDLRKQTRNGKFVFGKLKKANDFDRFLTQEETDREEGYDYFMFLDGNIWDSLDKDDQVRIIRHELRHILFDPEARSAQWKIAPHDIEDFIDEVEINKDDPRWGERVAEIASQVYDPDE